MRAHALDAPRPPHEVRGTALPLDLERVVMRCLEKQPQRRFNDAAELADALRSCAAAGTWRPAGTVPSPALAAKDVATKSL